MRAASHYALDSCLRTFYEGYRLFLHEISTHRETPTGLLKFVSTSPEVAK